jgi:hypothetical protein
MRSVSPTHSPSRKCQHSVDRNPHYDLRLAASKCEQFRGVSRPGSAAKFVEKKSQLFSSFTPTNIFPSVGGGPVLPVYGDMARQVDRQHRALKAAKESPQRERQHEQLAKELFDLRCTSPAELVRGPPPCKSTRSTSPMLEVAAEGVTREEAFELRGTSLVYIGGVTQPFIRPASAAAGSLQVVVNSRLSEKAEDEAELSSSLNVTVESSPTSAMKHSNTGGSLKVVYGQPSSRPGSSTRRGADAPDDAYRINVLLRSRPASGNTRSVPAEHYPLRSVVL